MHFLGEQKLFMQIKNKVKPNAKCPVETLGSTTIPLGIKARMVVLLIFDFFEVV